MNSQIVVNIDSKLKDKSMQMAKKEGLTMKALLSFLLKGYVENNIEINATIKQHKRKNYFEIDDLSEKEIELLENEGEFKNLTKKLNNLILEKGM